MRLLGAAFVVVVLALVAAVALPVSGGPIGPGKAEKAEAAECVWHRHAKRVVKHVRRHGRVRRVVRKRHWWTCRPVATPPVVVPPAPAPAPPAPPPVIDPQPEPEANRLSVRAAEHYFVLSRPAVRAGAVTVELNNQGEDPHNLNIRVEGGDDSPSPVEISETGSLQRSTATFDLTAGKYRLWCSLPEHEERGMYTTLVVE